MKNMRGEGKVRGRREEGEGQGRKGDLPPNSLHFRIRDYLEGGSVEETDDFNL
jgi:hypothetical protein